jgi:hypothetical protein
LGELGSRQAMAVSNAAILLFSLDLPYPIYCADGGIFCEVVFSFIVGRFPFGRFLRIYRVSLYFSNRILIVDELFLSYFVG